MKYYSYVEPTDNELSVIKVVMSEEEILKSYWDYWCTRMKEAGHVDLISQQMCIEDWCTVHWATPEDVFRFRSGYSDKIFCINEFNLLDPSFEWATIVCLNDPGIVIDGYVNVVTQMEKINV
jgi:hypothetical protein